MNHSSTLFRWIAVLGLLILTAILWARLAVASPELRIIFLDIGQGDAILVETPEHYQILIDTGPSGKRAIEKLTAYLPAWDRTIDVMILTHADADHVGGAAEILDAYQVKTVLWNGVEAETKTFDYVQQALEREAKEGGRIIQARKGQAIRWNTGKLEILHPSEFTGKQDSNAASIVAMLYAGSVSALFTGDIPKDQENAIIVGGEPIKADILKVGHHGSKTSTGTAFLAKVSPNIAVIQAGKNNSYGHPDEVVLENLEKYGIKIFRTDQNGDIQIKITSY